MALRWIPFGTRALGVLRQIDGENLIASGPSSSFTTPLLNAMVEWSLTKGDRICSLQLSDTTVARACTPRDSSFIVARCNSVAEEFDKLDRREVPLGQFLMRLRGAEPYFAVCMTGHGAEHCLALGSSWLTAATAYGLAGESIDVRAVASSLILLNGCSTLRLADSLVPSSLRLSTIMTSAGISVAGPYRNIRGSSSIEHTFIELVLAGWPAGRIVRELNVLLRDEVGKSRVSS